MRQSGIALAALGLLLPTGSNLGLAQKLIVGSASGEAGQQVWVNVRLSAGGVQVAGAQDEIGFEPRARVAAKPNGKPDCAVNGAIETGATSSAVRPSGRRVREVTAR